MKYITVLKTTASIAAMLIFASAQAQTMDKGAYKDAKTRISADFKTDKAACGALAKNAKDVCQAQAKAKEKVALAEAQFAYSGKPADQNKVMKVKAETTYAVAKEKCDDLAGNAKDVCVKEAKAVEVKALADVKMSSKVGEARKDGAQEKRDADYKVAAEKCDALAGDAKSSCMASAKTKFGKS